MRKVKTYVMIFVIIVLIFFFGLYIYPHSSILPSGQSLEPPNFQHIMGTDNLGIDIFAQISRGFFRSMFIGLTTAILTTLVGTVIGVLAGYLGGRFDSITVFLINVFLSVPQLPAMIVIGAFWGQSTVNIILIIATFSWASIAKVLRARVLSVKDMEYVKLAKSYGGGALYIIFKHLGREIMPLIMINGLSVVGSAIIKESSLTFLGLSDPTAKSWGLMISRASTFPGIYFTKFWTWWLLPPAIALIISVLILRLFSRALEQYWLKEG